MSHIVRLTDTELCNYTKLSLVCEYATWTSEVHHNHLVLVEDVDVAYKSLSKTLHNMKMLQSKNIRLNYIFKLHCVMF